MALTGLQIFKLLPNTNCKECGFATCLAFAMRVAAQKIEAKVCPYLSDNAKEVLGAAAVPPIRLLEIAGKSETVKVGEELVMFRHEKKFFHKTAFAICVNAVENAQTITNQVQRIQKMNFERAGEVLKYDLIAVKDVTGNPQLFQNTIKVITSQSDYPLILMSENPDVVRAGLEVLQNTRPLIYSATGDNWEPLAALAKAHNASLSIHSTDGLESLAQLSERVKSTGVENLVLEPQCADLSDMVKNYTIIRRLALEKQYKPFGHPTIITVKGADAYLRSVVGICKYASIVIFEDIQDCDALPLLTLRQNIFTDPQKPLQVDPGIYTIGEPDPSSPVFVTTNFSLTYFIVSTEIEGAGFSGYLVVTDAEGLSVLSAWSAGKFSGEIVGKFIKQTDLESRVTHRKLIIPGAVAAISGELEDSLAGWEVRVGPQEASELSSYLKETWS